MEVHNARILTLSTVFTELFPSFIFCNKKLVRRISLKIYKLDTLIEDHEGNQNAGTITLSPFFTELLLSLGFAVCPEHISESMEGN